MKAYQEFSITDLSLVFGDCKIALKIVPSKFPPGLGLRLGLALGAIFRDRNLPGNNFPSTQFFQENNSEAAAGHKNNSFTH